MSLVQASNAASRGEVIVGAVAGSDVDPAGGGGVDVVRGGGVDPDPIDHLVIQCRRTDLRPGRCPAPGGGAPNPDPALPAAVVVGIASADEDLGWVGRVN